MKDSLMRFICSYIKNVKGFALVEVVVVSIIVAVLSLTASMMYRGYVNDSKQNTANNMASSAAQFLATAITLDVDVNSTFNDLNGGGQWDIPLAGVQSTFKCPANVTLTFTKATNSIRATYKGAQSPPIQYDK